MAANDLIVVVPGIMGSTLSFDGRNVWTSRPLTVLAALARFGQHLRQLQLPEDIGDNPPNDGIYPEDLMPSTHQIPGLWSPIHGYESLVRRMRETRRRLGDTDESRTLNPVVFPYDWRLSNRYTARRLKVFVETALDAWRRHSPQNRDAHVIFVCHSMGGLIARWYIGLEGGSALTRKLITLGTPYRGSIKALSALANGPIPMLGKFGESLHCAIVTFPSVHQLLPSYACVTTHAGLQYLVDSSGSPLPTSVISDATQFYKELERAEAADHLDESRRHVVVGTSQPTAASATLVNDRYEASVLLGANDIGGDGTVSAASLPKGTPLDSNSIRRIADKHANLQCNTAALDEVESIIRSEPMTVKGANTYDLSVDAPELISSADRLAVRVSTRTDRRRVVITLRYESGRVVEEVHRLVSNGPATYATEPLTPGAYTTAVHDISDSTRSRGVTSSFLVWPS